MTPRTQYDAIVVGGGPAGAAAAAELARRGRRTLVVERERFPRFHIGESLLSETNRHLEALGVRGAVAAAGFPIKRGAILLSPDGSAESYADLARAHDVEHPETFEVRRDRFDQLLLDHAVACGAEVRQAVRAVAVALRPDEVEVTLREAGPGAASGGPTARGERTERARYLIDASGRDGFLAKRLGLRQVDPGLRHVAVHAWFTGVAPPPMPRAGDIRIVLLGEPGWAWLIPLDETTTSVGVVVRKDALPAGDPERRLERLLEAAPALAAAVDGAVRVTPARVEGDYSYTTRAHAGERWLLAGDAGAFLDPVFSTGVLLALEGGRAAAGAVDRALDGRGGAARRARRARRALARFQREQERTYRMLHRLVAGFYRSEVRDVLLQPRDRFGISDAVVTLLAGVTRPSVGVRLRIELFFALAALQRRRAVFPRASELSVELSDRAAAPLDREPQEA